MAHAIDYRLVGDDMQAVIITLDPDEAVQAEAGAMMFMENGVEMNTETGGGIMKGMKRILAGESFFITTFLNKSEKKEKGVLCRTLPGKDSPHQPEGNGDHALSAGCLSLLCLWHRHFGCVYQENRRGFFWWRGIYPAEIKW